MPPFVIPGSYRQQYLKRLEVAMNYIDQNLAAPLDLETVAQIAGFSPYHFHRIFTALMDENPQDYVNRLRVERAANMLVKNRTQSVTEIAFACGFSSASAFSRSFKKYFGVTAREYIQIEVNRPLAQRLAKSQFLSAGLENFHLPGIDVRQTAPIHLAYFASRRGYHPDSTRAVWVRLFQWANAHQLLTPETKLVGISFDDPDITPLHKCRYYACMTMPPERTADSTASFFDYPAHLCAVARMHCDDVAQIQQAYRLFYRDWLPDSGFLMANLPPYEIIYDAPDVTPGGQYVYDLCIPITVF